MRRSWAGWARVLALVAAVSVVLAGCASTLNGKGSVGNAPNANLPVKGGSNDQFDTTVKNALSDIIDFWKTEFPKVSGGKPLPNYTVSGAVANLKGGLYSVDGLKVAETKELTGPAEDNACAQRDPSFVIDNGAFCTLDNSIAWDRAPSHLFAQLAKKYGPLMVALIFAHEFGHSISYQLGVFDEDVPTIDTESQADCAAGAWAASALKGEAAHFRNTTAAKLDDALEGFLDGRDQTPDTPADVSHGNGFDRLSALADGIAKGVTYCYSKDYFSSRTFTERPYSSEDDYSTGGNTPLDEVLAPSADNDFVKDLNRFWTGAAQSISKTFKPVQIAEAAHPKCGSPPTSEFGYCPDDNTVYYSANFAKQAYYSLPGVEVDRSTGDVQLVNNQAADFALGTLFSIGWGMAVRHQLFKRSLTNGKALLAAACYTGAYAKDINVTTATHGQLITLSPADLDEGTSSMLDVVDRSGAFGARGTTGLERIQAFVKGYKGGLSSC